MGFIQVGLGVVVTFGDVRSYPLLFGLGNFICRTKLPDREQSCPMEAAVLWSVKKPAVDYEWVVQLRLDIFLVFFRGFVRWANPFVCSFLWASFKWLWHLVWILLVVHWMMFILKVYGGYFGFVVPILVGAMLFTWFTGFLRSLNAHRHNPRSKHVNSKPKESTNFAPTIKKGTIKPKKPRCTFNINIISWTTNRTTTIWRKRKERKKERKKKSCTQTD